MEPMPAARAASTARATSSGPCRRPSRRSSPRSIDCAPSEIRVTPASRHARRVATLVGPGVGLERHLGPGGHAEPCPDPVEQPGNGLGREQRRRATAEVDGFERLRRLANAGRAGHARRAQLQLGLEGGEERANPVARAPGRRPGIDDEVAVRAERHAERDVDVQRDRRQHRRCRRQHGRRWRHRSGGAGSREPTIRQPRGGRRRASISSTSRPRGSGWPVWPVQRNTANRVIGIPEEGRGDPAGHGRQPATDEPDADRQHEQVAVPARRAEAGRERVEDRLDDVRERRSRGRSRRSRPNSAPRNATSSMNAVTVALSSAPG